MTTKMYDVRYYPMSLHKSKIAKEGVGLRKATEFATKLLEAVGFVEIVNSDGVAFRRLETRWWSLGRRP